MLVSSPADRLRDKTRQSENYSANPKRGSRGSNRGVSVWVLVALAVLLFPGAAGVYGQANVEGQWQTVPTLMPINPIHVSLLHNGKILIVSGSGNYPPDTSYEAAIWDPSNNSVTTQPLGWDMFCSGMVTLPDGREMIFGGTLQYDPFHGWQRTSIYDPATGQFADMQDMAHGRWYPTATELSDGRLLVFSGLTETGGTNSQVEIYQVQSGWSTPYTAPWVPPLYPRMHLLPNGNVFYSGWTTQSQYFFTASNTWSGTIATTNYSGNRTYGSSVLLPLTPANGYAPKVMIFGGGNPATATTEIIDLSVPSPAWVNGPSMSEPRIEMNATMLPNGNIVTLGGSLNDEDTTTASLAADLFNTSGTITVDPAGTEAYERLYHSVSLLLPDGTVWVAGGNPVRGTYVPQVEIYSPPYLFNPDGSAATRPTISSVSTGVVGYGTSFQVQTPNAANISSVVLMKLASTTHAFNMDQRLVGLSFTVGSGALTVTGPPNGNIAPPGYYMLFLLNSSGVPSIAQFVQVSTTPTDTPPKGTITSPAGNIAIEPGQSVVFAGSGTASSGTIASYSWSLRGGTPNSSAVASPGSVTYSTPGTYTASLTVVDSAGNWDPSPPIRTIQVRQPAPVISSVVPNSGSQGQTNITATITGSNFQPGVTCSFGSSITVSSCTENSSTQVTAIISVQYNAGVGTSNLTVTNPDGGSGTLPNAFTVVTGIPSPAPTLASVSPNSGEQNSTGLLISLGGTSFLPNPICAFGEGIIVNTCVYNSSTQLIANITIPVNTFIAPSNVSVTNADGQSSTLVNGFTIVSSSNGFTPILLRGGTTAAYTDIQGIIWNADEDFTGGDPASTTHAIAGAIDPIVYQSERYGDFTYQFAVPNGPYNITLKFAEIYFSSPGQRQFNVAINGTQVLHNFDIVAAAGAPFTAVDKIFEATASAGKISIQFTSGLANYPKISAIEITNSSGVLVQLNPSAISLFSSQTQQFTTLVTGTTATGVTWSFSPQLGTLSSAGLYTAPASIAAETTTNVVATSVADPMQSTTAVVTLLPPVVAFVPTFVNSGGNAYTDTLGNSWAADNSFTGGSTSSTTHAIANTPDPTLYQTERYGDFSYQFAVPNGSYIVRLKFAEIYWSEPKQRVFNVAINGTAVLSDFDIVAAAGAPDTAIDEVFPVTVAGNLITIQFTTGTADLPKISAVEITAASGVSIQVSPTTASLYASQAQQFTASVTGSTNTAADWTFNPQFGTLTASGLYTAPASVTAAQTVTVTATSQADNTQSAVATVSLLPPVGSFASIFVNSGGNTYTDTLGNSWAADNSFTGGKTSSTTHAIANTPDPTLYQTERYGDFSYQFAVPNGIYGVTLKFAEIYWSGVGQRVFNVAINGTAVLSDFDILATAGAPDTAIDETFPVTVSGGTITIQFTTGTADLPKISAIEIKTSSGVGIHISPTSTSLLSARSQQFGATVTGTTNLGVNWTYNPQVGSLVTSGATAGLYSAPASVTTAQKISVTATSVADPTQVSSATVSLVPPFSAILVNSGGATYTDSLSQVWSADKDFIGGNTASTTKAILNTADPTLYQTERYGDFSYQFIVANGSYNVVLKFAEIYWTTTGQRIFNVAINGTPVLTSFDIVAAAGAPLTAIDKTFPVTVTANQVTIQFTSGAADLPKVSAIQIH